MLKRLSVNLPQDLLRGSITLENIELLDVRRHAPWLENPLHGSTYDFDFSAIDNDADLYKKARTLFKLLSVPKEQEEDESSDVSSEEPTQEFDSQDNADRSALETPLGSEEAVEALLLPPSGEGSTANLKYAHFRIRANAEALMEGIREKILGDANAGSLSEAIQTYLNFTTNRQAPFPGDALNVALRRVILDKIMDDPASHEEDLASLGNQIVEILNTPMADDCGTPFLLDLCQQFRNARDEGSIKLIAGKIEWAVTKGAFLNVIGGTCWHTPLHALVKSGIPDNQAGRKALIDTLPRLVRLFRELGANLQILNADGMTARDLAAETAKSSQTFKKIESCFSEVKEALSNAGETETPKRVQLLSASRRLPDTKENTALFLDHIKNGDPKFIPMLKSNPLLVYARNERQETALHILIQNHADLLLQRHQGQSILSHVLNAGAPINLPDGRGRTPLHLACDDGKAKVIVPLVLRGGDLSYPTRSGLTPIYLMARRQQQALLMIYEAFDKAKKMDTWENLCAQRTINGKLPVHMAAYYFGVESDAFRVVMPTDGHPLTDSHGKGPEDYAKLRPGAYATLGGSQSLSLEMGTQESVPEENPYDYPEAQPVEFDDDREVSFADGTGEPANKFRKKKKTVDRQEQTRVSMVISLARVFEDRY